jgi:hypothetical protein
MNITLSPEHSAFIAKYAALTGYTPEEFASWLLADDLKQFEDPSPVDSSLQETIGSMYFKDKESAERVQAWLLERVGKHHPLNSIRTRICSHKDGTFDVRMTAPDPFESGGRYQIA